MALSTGQVSVATTGTTIFTATNPTRISLRNQDATNFVAVGVSGVTTATGYRILAGAELVLHLERGDVLAGDADTATVVVEYAAQAIPGSLGRFRR